MQVNSSNGSLQQRFFSGTGSIGGIHLPDFNDKYIFSKKKSGVSDKEYRKQIREQAYEDFEKGQFQNKSEGFNRLILFFFIMVVNTVFAKLLSTNEKAK